MESVTTPPYSGLCRTCHFVIRCTFPRSAARPVIDCLEFSGDEAPAESRRGATTRLGLRIERPGENRNGTPGLCRTCERKAACTYPRPRTGVWFCEEYE